MHQDAPAPPTPDFEAEAPAVLRPQVAADTALASALSGLSRSLELLAAAAQDMRGQTQALADARKQAEEERAHYQQLFESAPDGYFVTDAEGVIVQANSTAARLLWIDLDRLIGRPLSAFVVSADRLRFRALLHRLRDPDCARRGRDWEIRFKSPSQPGFTGALNVTCEHDEAGRLQALRWLVRDVSERKRAEAALKTREREQRAVAELGRIALTGAPFDALAAEAVALAAGVLNMEYAALLQLPPGGKGFLLANGVGWKPELIGKATLSAEIDGLWKFTLAADQPVCVEDAQTEQRFRWPALLLDHRVRSGVTVIVRGREHPHGLLGVYGAKRACFSSDDVNFLRSLANVLAAALERIEAERALAKREAEIRLLTDSVPAMIAYVDSSHRYQYHNNAFERWLGVEVRGRHLSEVLGEDLYQRVRPWVDQALAGQEVRYERVQLDRSGKPLHLEARYVPHLADSGEVLGFFVLLTDITERKRMEEALRKSEQKLNSILSSLNDVVWSLSPQTYDLLYLSSAAARLYGHQLDEFFGDKNLWLKVIHPDDRERVLGTLSQLLNEGNCEVQYRIVRPDGDIRWVHDRGWVVYDSDGKRLRLDGIVTDITDRKLKEQELACSREKLRELSCHLQSAREDERTRIAREIHDELGSALTGIKMELAWCAKQMTRSRVFPKLRGIVDAIDSTIAIVRRITTDLRPSILDHVGLTGAIEWQAQEFERRLKIPCRIESCEELGELKGATAIFRVVQEALTNVAQHSGATQVCIRIAREGDQGVIEVHDNGRGVSAEEIEKTNSFGLLGMSERTAALGGNLVITGKPGVGTSVYLRFPLRSNGEPG